MGDARQTRHKRRQIARFANETPGLGAAFAASGAESAVLKAIAIARLAAALAAGQAERVAQPLRRAARQRRWASA